MAFIFLLKIRFCSQLQKEYVGFLWFFFLQETFEKRKKENHL